MAPPGAVFCWPLGDCVVALPGWTSVFAFCATANDVQPIRAVIATVANSLFLIMFLSGASLFEPVNIEVRLPPGALMCLGLTLLVHASSAKRRLIVAPVGATFREHSTRKNLCW